MIIATGEALGPGGVRVEGFPHVEIKFDFPLDDFFNQVVKGGATHHWAMEKQDLAFSYSVLRRVLMPILISSLSLINKSTSSSKGSPEEKRSFFPDTFI